MSLSQAEIALVVDEIRQFAGRSGLQRVFGSQKDPRAVVLRFREPGANRFLLISTATDSTRLYVVDGKPDQPDRPTSFVMLLRKWLEGATFEQVEQVGGDRVIRLGFRAVDPRWQPPEDDLEAAPPRRDVALIAELAGRVGNLYLVDETDKIIGKQTDEAIGGRSFERGEVWEAPPPPPNPDMGSEVRWELEALPTEEYARSERLRERYRDLIARKRREDVLQKLRSGLKKQVKRLNRRIEHVEEDLENIERAEEYRRRGELLQSAYGQVERGAESVEVPDFYQDGMPTVEIPLEPAKSLQENIEAYFHEANRYQEAREMVEERLLESVELRDRAEEAREDLKARQEQLEADEMEALRRELIEEGVLPKPTSKQRQPRTGSDKEKPQKRPYRTFRSTHDRAILVGRGAEANDTLSTKIARGRDLWLHARDWPGAHVIVRVENRDEFPSREDLLDAATLAAHFSGGKRDTLVDVTYTRAKHVRKAKGLPPGRVFVADESVIGVEVEQERLKRLLESEEDAEA